MEHNLKQYSYRKGNSPDMDQEYRLASSYGAVKKGEHYIFWKKGFRWSRIEINRIQRVYRRIEAVDTKMCCGNVNFDIQKLVFILEDQDCLELMIGEGTPREAEALYGNCRNSIPGFNMGNQKKHSQIPAASRYCSHICQNGCRLTRNASPVTCGNKQNLQLTFQRLPYMIWNKPSLCRRAWIFRMFTFRHTIILMDNCVAFFI